LVDSSVELYNYNDPIELESVLNDYLEEKILAERKWLRLQEISEKLEKDIFKIKARRN